MASSTGLGSLVQANAARLTDTVDAGAAEALAAVLATLTFLLTLFAMPALLMALLGLEPDWLTVIGTLSVVTFLMYFAPTPGGAGFSELAFAGLMAGQIGEGQLVLVIFAWRLLTIYLGMAIGGVVSFGILRPQGLRT